ncbi:hypothetical protein AURDEDRAFT_177532 [Auricularia subglabra TFB-10046 SS5]|uniref:Uncharacterized protein n=1 Tax=Auricularia subglabra (strain TFB-10046 / SS5) TaxID=717982 RepID=J0LAE2_AURST|nr:hypothetical protein AURDEDRAFT_177532 [Auricularia subglabra TFB-10046 SS5]
MNQSILTNARDSQVSMSIKSEPDPSPYAALDASEGICFHIYLLRTQTRWGAFSGAPTELAVESDADGHLLLTEYLSDMRDDQHAPGEDGNTEVAMPYSEPPEFWKALSESYKEGGTRTMKPAKGNNRITAGSSVKDLEPAPVLQAQTKPSSARARAGGQSAALKRSSGGNVKLDIALPRHREVYAIENGAVPICDGPVNMNITFVE